MADEAGDHLTAVSAMEIGSIGILTEDVVDPSGPGASGPPYGRSTAPPPATRTRTGFPRSARARPGWDRASSVPRGRRCRRDRSMVPGRRCRFATARPCHPSCCTPSRDVSITRHQQGFTPFARPTFPSPVTSKTGRAVLGLSPELHTPRHQVPERMPGQGQVFDTLTRATSPASADLPHVTTHNVRPRVATTGRSSRP